MANNCYNYIDIQGSNEDIKKLYSFITSYTDDSYFMFNKFLPTSKDFYNDFGTRWFCYHLNMEDERLIIIGYSAWSPPLELFEKISLKFPNLLFEIDYEEMGCDFGGYCEIVSGQFINRFHASCWGYKFERDFEHAFMIFTEEISDVDIDVVSSMEAWNYLDERMKESIILNSTLSLDNKIRIMNELKLDLSCDIDSKLKF